MPINIYRYDESREQVAWLCDGSYSLPDQVVALEAWLQQHGASLTSGSYVADIGFSIRPEAFGGGAVIEPPMMRLLADLGMALYLSEYPGSSDDDDEPIA